MRVEGLGLDKHAVPKGTMPLVPIELNLVRKNDSNATLTLQHGAGITCKVCWASRSNS